MYEIRKRATKGRETYDFKFKAEFTVDFPRVACAKDISSASWDRSCETLIGARISARWRL